MKALRTGVNEQKGKLSNYMGRVGIKVSMILFSTC